MSIFNKDALKQLLLLFLLLPCNCSCSKEEQEDLLSSKHQRNFLTDTTEVTERNRILQNNFCPLKLLRGNTYLAELEQNNQKYCTKLTLDIDELFFYAQCKNNKCNCANANFVIAISKITGRGNSQSAIKLEKPSPLTGEDGTIVVEEDSSVTEPTMVVIEEIRPSTGNDYKLKLLLPYCFAPSPLPSTPPSIRPSALPSMVPTSLPSLVPTAAPSSMPSAVPSVLPSSAPSPVPSIFPSAVPSLSSSDVPSLKPSIDDFCPVKLLRGNTYQAELEQLGTKYCVKLTVDVGGIFSYFVCNNNNCNSCATADFEGASVLSTVEGLSRSSESTIELKKVNPLLGESGIIVVKEDSSVEEPKMEVKKEISSANGGDYELDLLLPSCFAPSALPSIAPSISPSALPSMVPTSLPSLVPTVAPSSMPSAVPSVLPSSVPSFQPSRGPSSLPSAMPSLFPSIAPSTMPSLVPSLSPSLPNCQIEEVLGKIYVAPIPVDLGTFCFKLNLSLYGLFEVDFSGNDCSPDTFTVSRELSVVRFFEGSQAALLPVGGGDISGYVVVREDSSISSAEFRVVVGISPGSVFQIDLVLPSCDAPSTTPSAAPTTE